MSTRSSRTTFGRRAPGTAAALALAAGLCAAATLPRDGGEEVDSTRTALEKYVEIRRVISQEKRDWALGREVLTDRIEIVKDEIDRLRVRIEEASGNVADADEKRGELIAEKEELTAASEELVAVVGRLEERTLALVDRLPDLFQERAQPLTRAIPAPGEETEASLSARFQNVVGVLNILNKLQREITQSSEVRTLGNGKSAEVAAFYVGIGQAWYASGDRLSAGVGTIGDGGWTWTPADESAAAIGEAIAVLEGQQASFVRVPLTLR